MGRGPAGGHGLGVCLGGRPAQDPAATLHPMRVEQPASAPLLKLSTVNTVNALDEERLPKKGHINCVLK